MFYLYLLNMDMIFNVPAKAAAARFRGVEINRSIIDIIIINAQTRLPIANWAMQNGQ
jgi:hypothetical protein